MSFGFFLALAIYATVRVFGRELARRGLGTWREVTLFCWLALPITVLGAKLGGILDAPEAFLADPRAFLFDPEEHAFLGALGAGLAVFWLFFRVRGRPVPACLDALALALPLGCAVGRIGCFVGGCCYGEPCEMPWAYRPSGLAVSVHPTQLYQVLWSAIVYWFLRSRRDLPRRAGDLFLTWMLLFATGRFLVEWIRINPRYGGLSQAQWLCLGMIALAARLHLRRIPRRAPDPANSAKGHRGSAMKENGAAERI